jgi:L-ribulose-5-phosphate 3-epimerase
MIGLMQGRLTSSKSGKVQEFPETSWRSEFPLMNQLGISHLEWTVDWKNYKLNPIFSAHEQVEISQLCQDNSVSVGSITLDNLVEAPLGFKNCSTGRQSSLAEFTWILDRLENTDVRILVVPLVKESGLSNFFELQELILLLPELESQVSSKSMKIAFECEFDLSVLNYLVNSFSPFPNIGFNFDIGNSAAMGNDPEDEVRLLGDKIFNVHIKDRILNGKTVPLGQGNANFDIVFSTLKSVGYESRYILQAARSESTSDFSLVMSYLEFCESFGVIGR